jgi:hypothetical protein
MSVFTMLRTLSSEELIQKRYSNYDLVSSLFFQCVVPIFLFSRGNHAESTNNSIITSKSFQIHPQLPLLYIPHSPVYNSLI